MRIALIAALARGRVIGKDNAMPWRLPADVQHFKALTMGKPVVMGRRTFESIGKPLPGRRNIVVTRDAAFAPAGCVVAHGVAEAIAAAEPADELVCIGGARLYEQMLDRADRLYLTIIDLDVEGDRHFPPYEHLGWRVEASSAHQPDARNNHSYRFVTLVRALP
jgi:dihydrofolate reductase